MESKMERPCFIYLMEACEPGGPYYKIGRTVDPDTRLMEINCGRPNPARLFSTVAFPSVAEAQDAEAWIHSALSRANVRGEWFSIRPVVALSALRARRKCKAHGERVLRLAAESTRLQTYANRHRERGRMSRCAILEKRARHLATKAFRASPVPGSWFEWCLNTTPDGRPFRHLIA